MPSDNVNGAGRDSGRGGETQPEQLAAEIEQTREDLAHTLDAIADRVSPKRVAKRGTRKVTDTVKDTASSAKEAVTHKAAQAAGAAKGAADTAKGKAGELQGALHHGQADDPTGALVIDVTDGAMPGGQVRHGLGVDVPVDVPVGVPPEAPAAGHGVKSAAEHVREAAAARISQVRGVTPSGHSLSEPVQDPPVLLRKEVALGVLLAVVGLLLLHRRRSR
ncbi:MAG: hypothetical protein JWL64_2682 [Frankiales bacterium]|nr:hypothetical protein [Frankiales bacterium]